MNMTLSSNLKKFRLQKNYTQEYVANILVGLVGNDVD